MIFRPLELAWGLQTGFTICSFNWDDGSFNTFVGLVWDSEVNAFYLGLLFMGWTIDYVEEGDDE